MSGLGQRLWRCARLNWRLARLALAGRWLDRAGFAAGYDRVAASYDAAWQWQLRPVTDELLGRLPPVVSGVVLDLGCGTGYATEMLARRYPEARLVGVDLSAAMLERARARVRRAGVALVCADLLEHLAAQPQASVCLVFSAWALGYSHPRRVVTEAGRVLVPGGRLAFVVNYADTLAPVFRVFRRCMAEFPDRVALAARPRFPKDWSGLEAALTRHRFLIEWHQDGHQPIRPPPEAKGALLPWLLQTGVLAGFDALLPVAEPGPVRRRFEELLRADPEPLRHHYTAVVARRP